MPQPLAERFWPKVDKRGPDECWVWNGRRNQRGYGKLRLDDRRYRGAHRISWFLAHGEWPDLFVCHSCDNPPCVNPAHLWLGTNDDNIADRLAKGRPPGPARGEANRTAKLTPVQVLEIRAAGGRGADLARRFGVTNTTISHIRLGKTWRHLPLEEAA